VTHTYKTHLFGLLNLLNPGEAYGAANAGRPGHVGVHSAPGEGEWVLLCYVYIWRVLLCRVYICVCGRLSLCVHKMCVFLFCVQYIFRVHSAPGEGEYVGLIQMCNHRGGV
jgi:hypothetical protein